MNPMEIFTTVTGVVYILLEIKQKNLMWIVGMITSAATVYMFVKSGLYASAILNVYYFIISIVGFIQWRKDSAAILQKEIRTGRQEGITAGFQEDVRTDSQKGIWADYQKDAGKKSRDIVHLNRLTPEALILSTAAVILCITGIFELLELTGDSMSALDASVAGFSAVATYWLSKSYIQHWYVWIIANLLTAVMCLENGLLLMTGLYVCYMFSAVIGLYYWRKNGQMINDADR